MTLLERVAHAARLGAWQQSEGEPLAERRARLVAALAASIVRAGVE